MQKKLTLSISKCVINGSFIIFIITVMQELLEGGICGMLTGILEYELRINFLFGACLHKNIE